MTQIPVIPLPAEELDAISQLIASASEGEMEDTTGLTVIVDVDANDRLVKRHITFAEAAAAEVYAVLDEDGGVATAQFVTWLIDNGRMISNNYVTRREDQPACACFFGSVALCDTAKLLHLEPAAVLDAVDRHGVFHHDGCRIEIAEDGHTISEETYYNQDLLQRWRDANHYTVVERLLLLGEVTVGLTARDNTVLHFLRVVVQTYIAERSTVGAAARA